MKRHIILIVAVIASLLHSAAFADTLISGDIGVAANWSGGVLPTDPLTPGIIDASNTGATQGTIPDTTARTGLAILQTGGELAFTAFGTSAFDDVDYEITGGTFSSTVFGHAINNGSLFDINGGTLDFAGFTVRASTVNMTSGLLDINNDLSSQGGTVVNFSGGTVSVGRDAMLGFQPTTTYNLSGTTAFSVTRNMGDIDLGVRTINIGLGTGSASVGGNLEFDGLVMDWTSGSDFSFTANTVLDNGVATTWEAMWNAGQLTVDGGQGGTFADNFSLTGNTLTVIPEPATLSMIAATGALLLILRRRMLI